jgi:ATP-dependent Zn protease
MVLDMLWQGSAIADPNKQGIVRLTPAYQDAALHEAAHAIVAVVMRVVPRKVTIKPRSRKCKYAIGMVDRSGYKEPKTREAAIKRLNKELTIACAGAVATAMWNEQKMVFFKQAEAILLDHWIALQIVVDELAEKYTLTGKEVRELLSPHQYLLHRIADCIPNEHH